MSDNHTTTYSLGISGFIAAIVSYALNHSVWWAILHWFCGLFYIFYAIVVRGKEIIPAIKALFGV